VVKRVLEHRLTRVKAAALMSLNERQVRRMCVRTRLRALPGWYPEGNPPSPLKIVCPDVIAATRDRVDSPAR
jgi:hypothetical protein